jgi:hypothetical protein
LIIISKNLHSALFHQTLNNIFYITEKQNKTKIKKSFKDAFSWNLAISTKLAITEYQKIGQVMLEIQVLAWERLRNVVGLIL